MTAANSMPAERPRNPAGVMDERILGRAPMLAAVGRLAGATRW